MKWNVNQFKYVFSCWRCVRVYTSRGSDFQYSISSETRGGQRCTAFMSKSEKPPQNVHLLFTFDRNADKQLKIEGTPVVPDLETCDLGIRTTGLYLLPSICSANASICINRNNMAGLVLFIAMIALWLGLRDGLGRSQLVSIVKVSFLLLLCHNFL